MNPAISAAPKTIMPIFPALLVPPPNFASRTDAPLAILHLSLLVRCARSYPRHHVSGILKIDLLPRQVWPRKRITSAPEGRGLWLQPRKSHVNDYSSVEKVLCRRRTTFVQ